MGASIGSFNFDAMRGRLSPAAADSALTNGQNQRGDNSPISGDISTEKTLTDMGDVVDTSLDYRDIIGDTVTADINGTSISGCVVIDCRTSVKPHAGGKCLRAVWTLAAPATWSP